MINLKKIGLMVLVIYWVLAVSFYFLAGDQLRYRESRGNLVMPDPEGGAVELIEGVLLEQHFTAAIQRLEAVSVMWGTCYRPNAGTVTMELWDADGEELLIRQAFDASSIEEGGFTVLSAEQPMEGYYNAPLMLRLYSDSQLGSAVFPMLSVSAVRPAASTLAVNGVPVDGVLCFSAMGEDYIWSGLHYWRIMTIGMVLLLLCMLLVLYRERKGHSYVVNALIAMNRYRFLIRQLVSRDFKTKYKRSVLGVFWSFLNPLLTMGVQYVVFSTIFKSNIENFPAYLLIGIVSFNFFSEATGMALSSITGNAGLITKVYVAKYIYPLTRVISSLVNLSISLIPLILVCILTGVNFSPASLLAVYFLFCLVVFSLGLGLLLASSMVFFRDTQFLWGVLSMIWVYLTPIFYPESILPEKLQIVLHCNPLYHLIKSERMCIMSGLSPEPVVYVRCAAMAIAMLVFGALVFRKSQDKFVLYL